MTPTIFIGLKETAQINLLMGTPENDITKETILCAINLALGISIEKLRSKSKKREIVIARQIACYHLRKRAKLQLKDIGKALGGRDHSTVIASLNAYDDLSLTNKHFSECSKKVEAILNR